MIGRRVSKQLQPSAIESFALTCHLLKAKRCFVDQMFCPATIDPAKSAKARAFALASLPVGKTDQRSIAGSSQSSRTRRAVPCASSGANIQSEPTARPMCDKTAARMPSAALNRALPPPRWATTSRKPYAASPKNSATAVNNCCGLSSENGWSKTPTYRSWIKTTKVRLTAIPSG